MAEGEIDGIVAMYERFRELTKSVQLLEQERNEHSKNQSKSDDQRSRAVELKAKIGRLNEELTVVEAALHSSAIRLPNKSSPRSPVGSPDQNQVVEQFGPKPADKPAVDHVKLGKQLDILDFEAGAKVAGSQQYYLKNQGALLELALIQYAIKTCLRHGYNLVLPPDMVHHGFIRACGFNPRTSTEDLPVYSVQVDNDKRALVGTAEIPLAGYYSNQILPSDAFPVKMVGFGHCFRPEVGHYGAESRGLYRVHQFSKVEMFALTESSVEQSDSILEEILAIQKEILSGLGLHCRVLQMATEELGASAHSKYDIEAWFPFRKGWGELTSASNCTDFQSRRLAIRYKEGSASRFPHTLNGTALAIPRTIQAILENYQQAGKVSIPKVLHPFMLDGSTSIG